jgi:hypothetical protein
MRVIVVWGETWSFGSNALKTAIPPLGDPPTITMLRDWDSIGRFEVNEACVQFQAFIRFRRDLRLKG